MWGTGVVVVVGVAEEEGEDLTRTWVRSSNDRGTGARCVVFILSRVVVVVGGWVRGARSIVWSPRRVIVEARAAAVAACCCRAFCWRSMCTWVWRTRATGAAGVLLLVPSVGGLIWGWKVWVRASAAASAASRCAPWLRAAFLWALHQWNCLS